MTKKKNNKPLLQEGTIRRMMKLANMEALGNGFISEKYGFIPENLVSMVADRFITGKGRDGLSIITSNPSSDRGTRHRCPQCPDD